MRGFCGVNYMSVLGLLIGLLSITNFLFLLLKDYGGLDQGTKEYFTASYGFALQQAQAGDDRLIAGLDDDDQYQIDDSDDDSIAEHNYDGEKKKDRNRGGKNKKRENRGKLGRGNSDGGDSYGDIEEGEAGESTPFHETRMKLQYEYWDHTTSTIDVPDEVRPRFADAKRGGGVAAMTSLEILQGVLHGAEHEREFAAVDEQVGGKERGTEKGPPSCLVPDRAATRAHADETVVRGDAARPPLPVLNVGMPKMGTSTLAEFFKCAGYHATHDYVGNKHERGAIDLEDPSFASPGGGFLRKNLGPVLAGDLHEGVEIFKRAKRNRTMLDYNMERVPRPIDAHCQMDTNRVEGWYPQVKLLDELHAESPNSTFVLIFRPVKDWLSSVRRWTGMMRRMGLFEMPGLILTDEQLEAVRAQRRWHRDAKEFRGMTKPARARFIAKYDAGRPGNSTRKAAKGAKARRARYPVPKPPPPPPVTEIQLARWWCGHVKHIRSYVEQHPTHKLIELDLYDTDFTSSALYDLFQRSRSSNNNNFKNDNTKQRHCWGHANANKKKEKKESKRDGVRE